MSLHVIVLGSAAGGGFPQWNCGCDNCSGVRAGKSGLQRRTQDSVAVSADGENWFLLNASPDVRYQIEATPQLHPRAVRHSPIRGVVLTNGDLDHVLGLFHLRESQPLALYATGQVLSGLRENAALRTLQRFEGHLRMQPLELDGARELCDAAGEPSGIWVRPVSVPGKPPLHLTRPTDGTPNTSATPTAFQLPSPEVNVALEVRTHHSGTLVYASAIADAAGAFPLFSGASALLLDGTFWSEEELPDLGVPIGPAKTMAHQPIDGEAGSLRALRHLTVPRRIFTHLNNTNPLLNEQSSARATVMAEGWEVAEDGLYFRL